MTAEQAPDLIKMVSDLAQKGKMSMLVAYILNRLSWPEMLGAVADANTVFAVIRSASAAEEVTARLKNSKKSL